MQPCGKAKGGVYILHCPDPETASKIIALAKDQVTAITPTILEFPHLKAKAELIKKLKSKGIFLEEER